MYMNESGEFQIDKVRAKIREFGGKEFTSLMLPRMSNIPALLAKMVTRKEIALVRVAKVVEGKRALKVYREISVKFNDDKPMIEEPKSADTPWKSVFPEFYTPPKLSGRSRIVQHADVE